MDETWEERADRCYVALIDHMDRCLPCQAAGGMEFYMCERLGRGGRLAPVA